MTLTEFLAARYDEAEARAQAAIDDDCGQDGGFEDAFDTLTKGPELAGPVAVLPRFGEAAAAVIVWNTPRRALADLASKRAILALCDRIMEDEPAEGWYQGASPVGVARLTKLYLATPYADHPDYREEWRP